MVQKTVEPFSLILIMNSFNIGILMLIGPELVFTIYLFGNYPEISIISALPLIPIQFLINNRKKARKIPGDQNYILSVPFFYLANFALTYIRAYEVILLLQYVILIGMHFHVFQKTKFPMGVRTKLVLAVGTTVTQLIFITFLQSYSLIFSLFYLLLNELGMSILDDKI